MPTGYGLCEFVFQLTGMARKMTTTLGVSLTGTPTLTNVQNITNGLIINWGARLPTSYKFLGQRFYIGDGTATPPFIDDVRNTAGGNVNTNLYPPSVVHVVNKNTALGGRLGKGRMYIPGAKEGDGDNAGIIAPATLTTYNTSLANIKTAIEAVANIGNLYLLGHDAGNAPVQITSLTMRAKLGSQVRRLRDA